MLRQDIDANSFVGAKHNLFWRRHFFEIAKMNAFKAMPLENTKFPAVVVPCLQIERSADHHSWAAVKSKMIIEGS